MYSVNRFRLNRGTGLELILKQKINKSLLFEKIAEKVLDLFCYFYYA